VRVSNWTKPAKGGRTNGKLGVSKNSFQVNKKTKKTLLTGEFHWQKIAKQRAGKACKGESFRGNITAEFTGHYSWQRKECRNQRVVGLWKFSRLAPMLKSSFEKKVN